MGIDRLMESNGKTDENDSKNTGEQLQARSGYRRGRGSRFEDRHQRVTTYLEKDLFQEVENLRELGRIPNITALYNAAVREYIQRNFYESNE